MEQLEDAVLYHNPPMGPEKMFELDRSAANAPEGSLQRALAQNLLDAAERKYVDYTAAVMRRVAGDVATACTRRNRNHQNGEMIAQRAAVQKAEIQAIARDLQEREGWTEPRKHGWRKRVLREVIEIVKKRNERTRKEAGSAGAGFTPEKPPSQSAIYRALESF